MITIFNLFYSENYFTIKYHILNLEKINVRIDVNIRAFIFKDTFAIIFYNSLIEFPGYTIFNYPNDYLNSNETNKTISEIYLFINSFSYLFEFSKNLFPINILGKEIIGIKVKNFVNKIFSGVIIKTLQNNETEINKNFIYILLPILELIKN